MSAPASRRTTPRGTTPHGTTPLGTTPHDTTPRGSTAHSPSARALLGPVACIVTAGLLAGCLATGGVRVDPDPPGSTPAGRADTASALIAAPTKQGAVGRPVASSARMRPPLWGLTPEDVERAFSAPLRPWGRGHRGVDLAGAGVVLAPAAGIVTFAGVVVDRPVLSILHADGTVSSFEPVITELPPGTPVLAGQPVAVIASGLPHCAVSCLHWGVRRADAWQVGGASFDRYLDPLWLMGWSGPSVLWPHDRDPPPPHGRG